MKSGALVPWIVAAVFAVAFGFAAFSRRSSAPAAGVSAATTTPPASRFTPRERKVLYWTDPMTPGYKSDKPGKSPFMDMELVPVYEDGASAGAASKDVAGYSSIQLGSDRQ